MSKREHNTPSLLPSGYRQLEYLESTGTQYIDTRVYPTNKTYYYIDFQPLTATSQGSEIAGCRWTLSPNYMSFGVSDAASADYCLCVYAGNFNQNFYRLTPNNPSYLIQRHTAEIDTLNLTCRIDTYSHSLVSSTYTSNYSFFLFGSNLYGTIITRGNVRIFECKFSENSIPTRHYVPALRIADSKLGMFDLVNNQFYTNAGTGEFLYN